MNGEQWKQVWAIYKTVSLMPATEWDSHVRSRTDDAQVAGRVLEMLSKPESSLAGRSRDAAAEEISWREGTRIGRYAVGKELGRGGMGQVYGARDLELNRSVALKFLPLDAHTGSSLDRFMREARAASSLSHPNIVTVHEVIRDGDTLAIVMERVSGETLRALLNSPLPLDQVRSCGRQIAQALAAAHAAHIVHRDIKPENVMVRADGYVKVLDFGLADDLSAKHSFSNHSVLGTWRYMSPEQARSESAGTATDIFSLGIVLCEAATGGHPFVCASLIETLDAIVNRPPKYPPGRLPRDLEELILLMLAKDPAERPSAAKVAECLQPAGPAELPPSRRSFSRRWLLPAAAAAGGATAGFFLLRSRIPGGSDEVTLVQGGFARDPVFSPDGSRITFAWRQAGKEFFQIFVGDLRARRWRPLAAGPANDGSPVWSPDGMRIAFIRSGSGESALYVKPVDGGIEKRIASVSYSPTENRLAWLLDNRTLVVASADRGDSKSLWLIDAASGERRELTPARSSQVADTSPKRSPGGEWISFCRRLAETTSDLFLTSPHGGQPRQLTFDHQAKIENCWQPDGQAILFKATLQSHAGIWRVSLTDGKVQELPVARLAIGTFDVRPGRTKNGLRLLSQDAYRTDAIWKSEIVPGTRAPNPPLRFITSSGALAVDSYPAISPDGLRIAFVSYRSGAPELWVAGKEGDSATQLTFFGGTQLTQPSWAPDSNQLVFGAAPNGTGDLYVLDVTRGIQRQLTFEPSSEGDPQWSRDGRSVTFVSDRGGKQGVWRMRASGGLAESLFPGAALHRESPDGRWLYVYRDDGGLWRLPVLGGRPELVLNRIEKVVGRGWALGREGIYYVIHEPGPERWTVQYYELASGKEHAVCSFLHPPARWSGALAVSPDERWLLLPVREREESNIVIFPELSG